MIEMFMRFPGGKDKALTLSYEVMADRKNLEDDFGTIVRGMAYPYGTYNDEVVKCLQQCGIAYARTVVSTHDFQIPTNWLEMPATCHHNDPKLGELTDKFLNHKNTPKPWLFYLWGHSYEFERDNNWNVIKTFAKKWATGRRFGMLPISRFTIMYRHISSSKALPMGKGFIIPQPYPCITVSTMENAAGMYIVSNLVKPET